MKKWKKFWFEGNLWFYWVESGENWAKLLSIYYTSEDIEENFILDNAKICENSKMNPKYGFTHECDGSKILREFFEENEMCSSN